MSGNAIKRLVEADAERLFKESHLVLAAANSISIMHVLKERIRLIERAVYEQGTLR